MTKLNSPRPSLKKKKVDKLKMFLENDRKVLRFYAQWDDSANLFGEKRNFVIHFFLADNSVEVREDHIANSGRDAFPLLLARTKDVLKPNGKPIRDVDFRVGETTVIYARKMFIFNCDDATREYYKNKFGVTLAKSVNVKEPAPEVKRMEIPPYNGFGDEEDSLNSFKNLVPKKPKANFMKMNKFGKQALRFRAKLMNNNKEDKTRRFIVGFNLADDTMSVFEPVKRNSGIVGGQYMIRRKYQNEAAKPDRHGRRPYLKATDFFVGGTVKVLSRTFKLLSADTFTMVRERVCGGWGVVGWGGRDQERGRKGRRRAWEDKKKRRETRSKASKRKERD